MYEILENQTLILENVLTYRGVMSPTEIQDITNEMLTEIRYNSANVVGSAVVSNFKVYEEQGIITSDSEIMVEVNKIFKVSNKFSFKDKFTLTNAIKMHCESHISELNYYNDKLKEYIKINNFKITTIPYIITSQGEKKDELIMDIYVGVEK